MSQVYRFTDENGQVRLFAEIAPDPVPAAGSLIPVANATGVTVDSTTYDDTIKGSGKLTTLVFPSDQGALAIAIAGDAFPRWIIGANPENAGISMSDGTTDPYATLNFAGVESRLAWQTGRVELASSPNLDLDAAAFRDISPRFTITSGALPTVQLVTATGAQISTTRDAETITPCTFNPGAATTATVTVALSPDNVTYSTLAVVTEPAGVALDGTILPVKVRVPAGWYLKLTANAQAVLGLTTYY